MEIIKQEKKLGGRFRLLWLLLLVNIVLIAGVWQYHRLIVEVSDDATSDLYRRLLRPFRRADSTIGRPLKVALLQSEATATSFGDGKSGYYALITLWQRLMDSENFWYKTVNAVPVGADAEPFNLLVLPASRCMGLEDREAVKAFLRAGKGVLMTWAVGTQNEFGQWEPYSLLQEVGGMELVGSPPATGKNISTVMVSGGYPLTASLYPGYNLQITAFDQPLSSSVREGRTEVDGVWTDPEEPTFALHSVRERAAITHGTYAEGRFVWTGFTISSGQNLQEQRDAFQNLLRNAMLWAGHQVQAFKPVWPGGKPGVLSVSQDVFGPEDVNAGILDLMRKHRLPVTSFIRPEVLRGHPEAVARLMSAGEIGLLGNPDADYEGRSMAELQREFEDAREAIKTLTGAYPQGFRLPGGRPFSDHTQDALVRAGFSYLSVQSMDRIVPKAVRSYRPIKLVMRARTLWEVPEMPYLKSGHPSVDVDNTMPLYFSQILALGGLYCLSFTPSAQDADFPARLNALIGMAKRERVPVITMNDVITLWEGWDNIKIATRYVSAQRSSLKISNTWVNPVDDVIVNVEMPAVIRNMNIESMTLGTELPDSMSHSGVRWRLHLNRLGAGNNVVYYINMQQPAVKPNGAVDTSRADAVGEVW